MPCGMNHVFFGWFCVLLHGGCGDAKIGSRCSGVRQVRCVWGVMVRGRGLRFLLLVCALACGVCVSEAWLLTSAFASGVCASEVGFLVCVLACGVRVSEVWLLTSAFASGICARGSRILVCSFAGFRHWIASNCFRSQVDCETYLGNVCLIIKLCLIIIHFCHRVRDRRSLTSHLGFGHLGCWRWSAFVSGFCLDSDWLLRASCWISRGPCLADLCQ